MKKRDRPLLGDSPARIRVPMAGTVSWCGVCPVANGRCGLPYGKPCAGKAPVSSTGQARRELGIVPPPIGVGGKQGSEASKLRSGEAVGRLAGGACRLSQQAQEAGASVGKGRKLCRVADALREGDYGGAASKQARKLPAARPASSPSKARNTREQLGKLASWQQHAPCPGCPGRRRRGGPTGSRHASRTGPRRQLPRTARGQAAQAQAPAWGRSPAMCLLAKVMTHLLWP